MKTDKGSFRDIIVGWFIETHNTIMTDDYSHNEKWAEAIDMLKVETAQKYGIKVEENRKTGEITIENSQKTIKLYRSTNQPNDSTQDHSGSGSDK